MRKFFLLSSLFAAMFFLNGCTYLMLWQYSSAEKDDNLAEKRMTALEQEREKRMLSNPNYRSAEIEAYQKARGIQTSGYSTIDTRPVSTQELRERLEREQAERNKR